MAKQTSCGVVVTDGRRILLGHATRSPRWDIPKGLAEPGESFAAAAVRELAEETGLIAAEAELHALGVFAYLRDKDLMLFAWQLAALPSPEALTCRSTFTLPGGAVLPEFDRFGLFDWDEALGKVGKNMARVLGQTVLRLAHTQHPLPALTRRPLPQAGEVHVARHGRSAGRGPPRGAPPRSG
jgi:putative (di)nucleoside polyphosphate hydrolase